MTDATVLAVNGGRFFVIVDAADLVRLGQKTWTMTNGYPATRGPGGRPIYLHRFITDAQPGEEVDHLNGNRTDNRRSNLRRGSRSENTHNRKLNRNNTSGYKGVNYRGVYTESKRWRARIRIDGKEVHLGGFATAEEAACAFDEAARKFLGPVARYNFPREGERSAR